MMIDAINEMQGDLELIAGYDPETSTWHGRTVSLSDDEFVFAREAIQSAHQSKEERYSKLPGWTAEAMQSYKQKARDSEAAGAFRRAQMIVMNECVDFGKISAKDREILHLLVKIELPTTSIDFMMMLKEQLNEDFTPAERQSAEAARFVVNKELLKYASRGLNKWGFPYDPSDSALGDQVHMSRIAKAVAMSCPKLVHTGISFINGMDNEFHDAYENAMRLSGYAAAKISLLYNATHGKTGDVLGALWGKCLGLPSYNEALLLFQWEEFFEAHGPDAKFLQICHSKGAIHVKMALSYATPEMRNKIVVVAVAPASIIRPGEDCGEAFNYVSDRDTWIKQLHSEFLGDRRYLEIVPPHPDADGYDHSFNSPTFQEVISKRIKEFIQRYEARQ